MDGKSVDLKKDNKYQEQYIVCYLDILGYKELVNNQEVSKVESDFENTIQMVEELKRKQYNSLLINVELNIFSDTIIIRMPLFGLKQIESFSDKECKTMYIQFFFDVIRMFYFALVGRLGYFIRGGIEIGQHYERFINYKENSNKKDNLFIFSQALINAHLLEQKAEKIRILIGDSIISYIKGFNNDSMLKDITKELHIDHEGLRCLDLYLLFRYVKETKYKKLMQDIIQALKEQIKTHRTDEKVMRKYRYFVKNHNEKIKNMQLSQEFIVNMFEEI